MTVIPIQNRLIIDNCRTSSKTKDQKFDKAALKRKKFPRERDSARLKTRNHEFNKSTIEPLEISLKTRNLCARTGRIIRRTLAGEVFPRQEAAGTCKNTSVSGAGKQASESSVLHARATTTRRIDVCNPGAPASYSARHRICIKTSQSRPNVQRSTLENPT